MSLIRHYADKVAGYLPGNLRADTADELFDSLSEQFEEAKTEAPNLTEIDFLNTQPHPIRMATQLGQNENLYLIGPGFYLSFIEALKYGAWIALLIQLPFWVGSVMQDNNLISAFTQSLVSFPSTFFNVAIVITIIFIIIEKAGGHPYWLDKWNARTLELQDKKNTFSKFELLFELNVYILATLWLSSAIELPFIEVKNEILITELLNVSNTVITLIFSLLIIHILLTAIKLVQGYWVTWLRVLDGSFNALWLGLFIYLINIETLLNTNAFHESIKTEVLINIINQSVTIALFVATAMTGWEIIKHAKYFIVKIRA